MLYLILLYNVANCASLKTPLTPTCLLCCFKGPDEAGPPAKRAGNIVDTSYQDPNTPDQRNSKLHSLSDCNMLQKFPSMDGKQSPSKFLKNCVIKYYLHSTEAHVKSHSIPFESSPKIVL